MRAALILFATAMAAIAQDEIRLVRVAGGFASPVDIQDANDGTRRLFIVEQGGTIRIIRDGAVLATPFLNITSRTRNNGECGLLGLAFPPGFREKRYFYVNYTDANCRNTVVARYRVSSMNNDAADASSEEVILQQAQPFSNHNGGQLAFGPDGFLYIGLGDGGSGGDPQNHGQTNTSLLGKMLRVDTESGTAPYRVPPSNPFVNDARYRPEIWATGLRNPWRYSFDRETNDLWIADVGQNRAEEIDFQPGESTGGENYGWRTMEGLQCFNPATNCNRTGLTLPVHEYTRAQGDVSVTGGFVYRGARWPSLRGTYIYADYISRRIWGLRREGPLFNNRLLMRMASGNPSTFGQDAAGELYVADHAGIIHRIEAAAPPTFTNRSVLNGASFDIGLTPGSAVTLFASGITGQEGITAASAIPLPRTLAGARVLVNGFDSPLYAVANVNGLEQINFQAPFNLTGPTARVAVSFGGQTSPEVEIPIAVTQPGIFVSNNEVIFVDAVTNALVPARPNALVYFYATGLGPVDNQPALGAASPSAPLATTRTVPQVTIAGVECQVLFAGLAPGFVGIYQVNIRVAAGVPQGRQEMLVSVGGVRGRPAFTTVP